MSLVCSKIGILCPHPVPTEENYIFTMMPFKDFGSVYDTVKRAIEELPNKSFLCERDADTYTNHSIWCERICKSIRKAQYLIVDTTGTNPNVMYELGFAHAIGSAKAILITQDVGKAPFDVSEINHIVYSEKNLPELYKNIQKAITDLEQKKSPTSTLHDLDIHDTIRSLEDRLKQEEIRSSNFKNELIENEERERRLKERIKVLESIEKNPMDEAEKKIAALEKRIFELKSHIEDNEQSSKKEMDQLEEKLKAYQHAYRSLDSNKDQKQETVKEAAQVLSQMLYDDSVHKELAILALTDGNSKLKNGLHHEAIESYTKAIELCPEYTDAYVNRARTYIKMLDFNRACDDLKIAETIDANNEHIYNLRGLIYSHQKDYHNSFNEYIKSLELNPKNISVMLDLAELSILIGEYRKALTFTARTLTMIVTPNQELLAILFEYIAKLMLGSDTREVFQFQQVYKKINTITWSFNELDQWIPTVDDTEKKEKILYLVNLLKKKKNPTNPKI